MIEDLAGKLGGAAGASRAMVDAGWCLTAIKWDKLEKVVKPDVYIAAGNFWSYSTYGRYERFKTIIAINKDPEAPIFSIADLGIVGDVHKVLPALLEAIGE